MQSRRAPARLSPPAQARSLRAALPRWLLACLCCLATLSPGCVTENQERFKQYTEDGVHLFQRGDYAGARDHFEVALTIQPKDANLLYNLGQCHDRLSQPERAESYYQQCLQLASNHAECRHALAVLLYRAGRAPEANSMIEAWLASEPKLAAAYALDGWRLRQCGEVNQAVGRFQQALHHDPRNLYALLELGQIYEEHQRPEFALTMYRRALEIDPHQPDLTGRINDLRSKGIRQPLAD